MNILVVGSGGREHAIVWKLRQSPHADKIYCAPGNAGISEIAECVNIRSEDIDTLVGFAKSHFIELTVVGPEGPLSEGITDRFEKEGLKCFGPGKCASEIEGSKSFAKKLMEEYGIPTAKYEIFENPDDARAYLVDMKYPVVLKADGLAAGKGVIIAQNSKEAYCAVSDMMEHRIFKSAGERIIVEEYMEGTEVSVLAFTDGYTIVPMVSAKDHKRVFDNDRGPNTGGMGTISPSPDYTDEISKICMKKIFKPTIEAMRNEGRIFKGVLFFGLMLTCDGPKVVEYNCRFGDPETQAVLPRLKTDLVDIMLSVIESKLDEMDIEWDTNGTCCVMLSSSGYPGPYEKGKKISGLEKIDDGVMVFHSGTKIVGGNFVTDGGRVLGVTASGKSVEQAAEKAYWQIKKISFEGMHYRKDIEK